MNTIIFLFFGIIFGYVFAVAWCKIMVKRYGVARIKGYHLHHTLFIILFLLFQPYYWRLCFKEIYPGFSWALELAQ